MRLLPGRPDHGRRGTAESQTATDRRGHRFRLCLPRVSLRDLSPHQRGHQGRRRSQEMSSRADLSRRSFLRVVGGAGASFVLGSFAIASCSSSPVALDLPSEGKTGKDDLARAFAPNGYTRLDPDGKVTITICRSDMGQGVRTSLAMLAAEEMDADWSAVKVVQAGGGNFNPAGGGTGGSSTITSLHQQMRKMGAASRVMLVGAAAKQWGVDPATCKTENGKVI